MKRLFKLMFFIFLIGYLAGCDEKISEENWNVLTNGGSGRFWDIVYQTDTGGNPQRVLLSEGHWNRSMYFFGKDSIINYYNYDSVSVVDINRISDVVKPYNSQLTGDTLNLNGFDFLITKLTDDTLKLQSTNHKKVKLHLVKSRIQKKIIENK